MKCIIIEDQPPAQRILQKYISDIGYLELAGVYTNVIDAMHIIKAGDVDLMFLDIHLPKMSGIDFLKTLHNPPNIILTTAFQDYALESYEYSVTDYLLKPFSFERFVKAVGKVEIESSAISKQTESPNTIQLPDEIFVKSGHDHLRIKISDIYYITSDSDYTELHTSDKKYLTSKSLRHWEEFLESASFLRIHKSYIVNANRIHKISGGQVVLENHQSLPIGRAYKSDLNDLLIN